MVNRRIANAEALLTGSAAWISNAERNSGGLWVHPSASGLHCTHLRPLERLLCHIEAETSQGPCEILGNIRSRERKLVCNRSSELSKKIILKFLRVGDHEAMTQAIVLLEL